jgi:acyl-CoA thioesterase-1
MYSHFFYKVALKGILAFSLIVATLVALPATAQLKKSNPQTIVVFGDSLSAGYGLEQNQGWVTLLKARLTAQNLSFTVINSSISGETTSSGLARFKQMLATHKPSIVILELGANDGLRGLPVAEMRNNLSAMIKQSQAANIRLLLIGMKIPPNYGKKYTQDFSDTYPLLANQHAVKLVPFFLEGIAGQRNLIQDDGLHPLAIAQPQLLNNVWPMLNSMMSH